MPSGRRREGRNWSAPLTTPCRPHRTRTWVYRITATLIGIVLALVLVELTLRLFDLAPVGGVATVNQRDFERLPGLFTPGQRLIDRVVPALPHQVTIDSLGYRGVEELPRAKPPGEIRIVLLGDSFTFGYLVDDDNTLPAQLERLLRARCSGPITVINAGVGGSSIETAAAMAERALPLGVDLAVLSFTENDVTDLVMPMWNQLTANRTAKSRFPMSIVYPVARKLALWNLLLKAQATWTVRRSATAGRARPASGTVASDTMLLALRAEYADRLVELRDRLAGAGVPLVFAIFPSHLLVYGENSGEQVQWVERTAREAGLPTVNYTSALQRDRRPREQLYLFPYDAHPSAAGYAVAAPLLEAALIALPPLSRRCDVEVLPQP